MWRAKVGPHTAGRVELAQTSSASPMEVFKYPNLIEHVIVI